MGSRFCRYELRTTNVGAARDFYTKVVGPDLWGEDVTVAPLPESAAARGAPAHWLGHLRVDDVEETSRRFVAAGAQRLGPPAEEQASRVIFRDPAGAVVAVTDEDISPRDRVAWHLMHSRDEARAFALYSSLFGWTPGAAMDLGPERGRHQVFSWEDSGREVGSTADGARQPHIHPQWLYFFRVADMEGALTSVRALGGLTIGIFPTPTGALVAPCDDPQGGAFGIFQETAPR